MMKPSFVFLAAISLALAACGGPQSDADTAAGHDPIMDHEAQGSHSSGVHMEDGIQVVAIEAGQNGYEPAQIELTAGIPVRLLFTRTTTSPCLAQVMAPEFGIDPVDLPMNEAVAIEFTPEVPGTYSFACGMDMQHGTVIVRS